MVEIIQLPVGAPMMSITLTILTGPPTQLHGMLTARSSVQSTRRTPGTKRPKPTISLKLLPVYSSLSGPEVSQQTPKVLSNGPEVSSTGTTLMSRRQDTTMLPLKSSRSSATIHRLVLRSKEASPTFTATSLDLRAPLLSLTSHIS